MGCSMSIFPKVSDVLHCVSVLPCDIQEPVGAAVLAKNDANQFVVLGVLNVDTEKKTRESGSFTVVFNHAVCGARLVSIEHSGKTKTVVYKPLVKVDGVANLPSSQWAGLLNGADAPEFCRGYSTVYLAYTTKSMETITLTADNGDVVFASHTAWTFVGFQGLRLRIRSGKFTNPTVVV